MKFSIILSLLFSMGAFAQQDQPLSEVKYKSNDGTARPENPGTFRRALPNKKKSAGPDSGQSEIQKEEARKDRKLRSNGKNVNMEEMDGEEEE